MGGLFGNASAFNCFGSDIEAMKQADWEMRRRHVAMSNDQIMQLMAAQQARLQQATHEVPPAINPVLLLTGEDE
jgi:hypothetical protein